jgi:hypothetical protein
MKLSTRESWVGGGSIVNTYLMQGTWNPCYSGTIPGPLFVTTPALSSWQNLFEAKNEEDNDVKNSHAWKDFEHYKRFGPEELLPSQCRNQYDGRVPSPFNACNSYDIAVIKNPLQGWAGFIGGVGQYNPWVSLPAFYEPGLVDVGHFVRLPANLSSLNQRALNSMMPGIKAEVSLINSIIELKDFKTLGTSLRAQLDTFLSFAKIILKGGSVSSTLRQLLRSTADGYLQAQFNILPLLKDIHAVMHVMSTVDERIRSLILGVGKKQTKHFRFTWAEFPYAITATRGPYILGPSPAVPVQIGATKWTATTHHEASIFNAEIQYNYKLTGWEIEHARLLGYLDALGININPAIIWNAIPYSFIVDWVLSVSSFLSSLKTPNIAPTVNVTNYCWSIKRQRTIDCQFDYWGQHAPGVGVQPVTLPSINESAYRREVGMPDASSLVTSGLNVTEFSLGAALLITRKARRRRWKYPKYPRPPKRKPGS